MMTLTHSISILVAACVACLALWGEHYHPWSPNGSRLDVRWNYVLGVAAMLIPYTLMLSLWAVLPHEMSISEFVAWAIVGLWVIVAASGLVVYNMHEWDAKRNLQQRAEIAERAERARRESAQSGG